MQTENYLTTPQVAKRLGVSIRRVQALIKAGRLPSRQYGRDHIINEADLALVADRKPGRPKKADEGEMIEATRLSAPVKTPAKKATKKRAAKKGRAE
jgi:excisionase family DNA binding protein